MANCGGAGGKADWDKNLFDSRSEMVSNTVEEAREAVIREANPSAFQ